ncbi:hypothetical protein ACNS7O_14190 [Haloferacaceae archaeon DSL9]
MIWQDLVFLAGSSFSIIVLAPTLRDQMASVPLGTSVPSALIGIVYATTFFTLGMHFSALGSLVAGCMWTLIAALRAPDNRTATDYLARLERYAPTTAGDGSRL